MREKLWGIKKDHVDRFMRRMEREFQFELQKLELEALTIEKENEKLLDQINNEGNRQLKFSENDPFWQLANQRMKNVMNILESQKDNEMNMLRKAADLKVAKLKAEINNLDEEISSINQFFNQFINQLDTKQCTGDHSKNKSSLEENAKVESSEDHSLGTMMKLPNSETRSFIDTELITPLEEEAEQIDSFKTQYMIGKISGSDIFDNSDNLIIPMKTKITKEIVELANKEGKLAELIINMEIPEVGEE